MKSMSDTNIFLVRVTSQKTKFHNELYNFMLKRNERKTGTVKSFFKQRQSHLFVVPSYIQYDNSFVNVPSPSSFSEL